MLYFLISMLIMLALFDKALRKGGTDLLLMDLRFRLFALRDELREGAIEGALPENKWFAYLDTTITKAIDLLPTITVWEVLGLVLRYRNDERIQHAQLSLMQAFAEEENEKLAPIYAKFVVCIAELLFLRHIGIRYLMKGVARVVVSAQGFRKRAAEIVTVAPETSTFTQYA